MVKSIILIRRRMNKTSTNTIRQRDNYKEERVCEREREGGREREKDVINNFLHCTLFIVIARAILKRSHEPK